MSKKKIYIKIDKPIEVGDLVRCVRDTFWFEAGDIRKVHSLHGERISVMGDSSLETNSLNWEPVRKLKVGDRVQFRGGNIMTVTAIHPDGRSFDVEGHECRFFATDQFTFYQFEKHDPKPAKRREFMERAVAEMVVELLDKGEWSNTKSLLLANYRSTDNSIAVKWNLIDLHEAKLAPNDTWDTLTGVFVALSKATGRKLPDWIYGEVK